MALAFLVPLDYTLMVTSGLFIKLSSLPNVIRWFRYFSWFMFSNEALTIIHWENVNNISTYARIKKLLSFKRERITSRITSRIHNFLFSIKACEYVNPDIPCLKTGEDVLNKFDFSPNHLWENIFAMGIMYLIFHFLACLFLFWRTRKNS